jgi:hypothetical protein
MIRSFTLMFLMVVAAVAVQAEISVTDDTFTSTAAPSKSFGSSIGLVVQSPTATGSLTEVSEASGYTANAYVRFNVIPSMPAGLNASNVSKATLRLFVNVVVSPGTFEFILRAVLGKRALSQLRRSAQLSQMDRRSHQASRSRKAFQYVDIDVTSAVQAWINTPASNYGLVLVPSPGSAANQTAELRRRM